MYLLYREKPKLLFYLLFLNDFTVGQKFEKSPNKQLTIWKKIIIPRHFKHHGGYKSVFEIFLELTTSEHDLSEPQKKWIEGTNSWKIKSENKHSVDSFFLEILHFFHLRVINWTLHFMKKLNLVQNRWWKYFYD